MSLPKVYEPDKYEVEIYKLWEKGRAFEADPNSSKEHFSISMPPPNETGTLHVGHALFLTLQDIMARHARQQGKDVLWLPGTDHAAIATNAIIEKQLAEQGTDKHQMGREAFIKTVQEFVGKSRDTINSQIRAMGASCDWSRARYTLDDMLNRCVNEVFVKMYRDGLIYRGHRIVNWDPKLETTVSDDEVVYKEQKDAFYTFQYGPFQIGTARPETKFGDKYVVMHPDDKRYAQYKHGDTFDCEWINGKVKATVIKDEVVDPKFGTGVMTITPWHDHTDFEIAERHGLEKEQIIGFEGRLLPIAQEFAGMKIDEARPKIVKKLEKKGLLVKTDENYKHSIALNDRGKGVIEPQIRLQWFVDVNRPAVNWKGELRSFKEVMRAVIEDGDVRIIPKRFEKVYFHWIDNLRDWCISRQIWWGHQVPVWYKKSEQPTMGFDQTVMNQLFKGKTKTYRQSDKGYKPGDKILAENTQTGIIFGELTIKKVEKTTVGQIDLKDKSHFAMYNSIDDLIAALKKYYPDRKIDKNYSVWIYEYDFVPKEVEPEIYVGTQLPKGQGWQQDPDTLDTWFSSALWTWSTLIDPDLADDYSLSLEDLLERSPDFRAYHPTSVMETGWDILFFWVARMILATTYATGQIPFKTVYLHGLVRTETGKKMSKSDPETIIDPMEVIPEYGTDALRLALVSGVHAGQDQRLGRSRILDNRNFCNKLWNIARYIEEKIGDHKLSGKPQPQSIADEWILSKLQHLTEAVSADLDNYRFAEAYEKLYHGVWDDVADWYIEASKVKPNLDMLAFVLETVLKLVHPFAPFVTEAIWQNLHWAGDGLLITSQWPKVETGNKQKSKDFEDIKKLVSEVRYLASELELHKPHLYYQTASLVSDNLELIKSLSRVGEVNDGKPEDGLALTSTKLFIWLKVDPKTLQSYAKELQKRVGKQAAVIKNLEVRLANKAYVDQAPEHVVEQTKQELNVAEEQLAKLKAESKRFES